MFAYLKESNDQSKNLEEIFSFGIQGETWFFAFLYADLPININNLCQWSVLCNYKV